MPDLRDGESTDVKGSTGTTYTIKNVGGIYACSCMAWRTQSLPVDRRTCKHIRQLRGDAAEDIRTGSAPAASPTAAKPTPVPAPAPVAVPMMRLPVPHETEAVVTEYRLGSGQLAGFQARLGDGQAVVVGGLTDRDKVCPPPIGGIITLRFQQITATGVPFAPTFVGSRPDNAPTLPLPPKPQ